MAALATIEDVEDRLGRAVTDADERLRIDTLLADASAKVRAYTGRQWQSGTVTTTMRVRGGFVTLGKAASVTSITNPATGQDVPYVFDGIDRAYIWPSIYRSALDYDWPGVMPATITVTYVADDPVPDAVKAVVCQMVGRAFGTPLEDTGRQQESITNYSYTVGAAAAAGAVGMLQDERETLDLFAATYGTIWAA